MFEHEFKVGDRIEGCLDGRFDLYADSSDTRVHDFGVVTSITEGGIWCKWESCEEEINIYNETIRKVPTYTQTQIKAFLETLRTEEDEEFISEREWASQIFDKLEAFVNKPTQDEEALSKSVSVKVKTGLSKNVSKG